MPYPGSGGSGELAQFLRSRREALRPGDVALPVRRRRTAGLRREEVASLAAMSADYYRRLEQARIAPPSNQILDSLARALRLTPDERDYLYRLADREPPAQPAPRRSVEPGLRKFVDGMGSSPAQVMTLLGETLVQNAASIAMFGDHSVYTGYARNTTYRWFTDPASRLVHPREEHDEESHSRVADLRARSVDGNTPEADRLIGLLRARSAEFERIWLERKVAICRHGSRTMVHPMIGALDLDVQILRAEGAGHLVVVFTAGAGTPAADGLHQAMSGPRVR